MHLSQPRLKSGAWERLRGVLMEKTGSNIKNTFQAKLGPLRDDFFGLIEN